MGFGGRGGNGHKFATGGQLGYIHGESAAAAGGGFVGSLARVQRVHKRLFRRSELAVIGQSEASRGEFVDCHFKVGGEEGSGGGEGGGRMGDIGVGFIIVDIDGGFFVCALCVLPFFCPCGWVCILGGRYCLLCVVVNCLSLSAFSVCLSCGEHVFFCCRFFSLPKMRSCLHCCTVLREPYQQSATYVLLFLARPRHRRGRLSTPRTSERRAISCAWAILFFSWTTGTTCSTTT